MKTVCMYFLALLMASVLVLAANDNGDNGGKPDDSGNQVLGGDGPVATATGDLETRQGQLVGNDKDEHGCIPSAGYSWCDAKQKCLRPWEENCTDDARPGSANAQEVRVRVEEKLQERQKELDWELTNKSEKEQKVLKNQNPVRLAVHALLEMKDEIGGIGQNVSAIAREFNNSIQSTIETEKKVQERSAFSRFFAGGDKKAGAELTAEVKLNKELIEKLKQLKEECGCGAEAKTLLEEQIQTMEVEQTRLQAMADKETKSKGLFGWLWK